MSRVELPEYVKANIDREVFVVREEAKAHALSKALRSYNDRLDLVLAADNGPIPPPMVHGCWHIRKRNDGVPDTYIPITTPNGDYMEPHHGIIDSLRRADLQNRDVFKECTEAYERSLRKKEADEETASEARVEEMASVLRAGARVAGEGGMERRAWGRGKAA